jgi:hypothetical protein
MINYVYTWRGNCASNSEYHDFRFPRDPHVHSHLATAFSPLLLSANIATDPLRTSCQPFSEARHGLRSRSTSLFRIAETLGKADA